MIPPGECHIAEKYDSESKWSFLHIQITNFKEMTAELLGSQNLPSSWAMSHTLGCEQAQGGGVCVWSGGGGRVRGHAQANMWLPLEGKHKLSESASRRVLGKLISELERKANYNLWSNEFQI